MSVVAKTTLLFSRHLGDTTTKVWVGAHRDADQAARGDLLPLGQELAERARPRGVSRSRLS